MNLTIQTRQNQIKKTLRDAGVETAVLDARLLMMFVLDVSIEELLLRRYELFPISLENQLNGFVKKRAEGMPIAKIIGQKEFWGLPFKTSTNTLDPRPDSETLVEAVLHQIDDKKSAYHILDLGTGTGCLLISLLCELPNATGLGVDKNLDALKIAQENACENNVANRSEWRESNWFSHIDEKFDIIISNPPYIPSADMADLSRDVREYDPLNALDGGMDGLEPYRILARDFQEYLNNNDGFIAVEYGAGQSNQVRDIWNQESEMIQKVYKDLSGIKRCSIFYNK